MVITMMMVLYTHRHQKQDVFIVEARDILQNLGDKYEIKPMLNGTRDEGDLIRQLGSILQMKWDVIRDCLYKYSKKA